LRPKAVSFAATIALAIASGAAWLTGCAGGERAGGPRAGGVARPGDAAGASRLDADEAALFRALAATDARLAVRFGAPAGEPGLPPLGFDVFAFDRRALRVEDAARTVASWRYPLPREAALELALVRRMVAEERARVDEERRLPRSASELVRAVVATWAAAPTPDDAKQRDAWLAENLDEVRGTLSPGSMSWGEANELDDALDALEHAADGYEATERSLALLRVALGEVAGAPTGNGGGRDRWAEVRGALKVHVGIDDDAPTLRALFEAEEKKLRAEIGERARRIGAELAREAEEASAPLLFVEGRCDGRGSRIRRAAPPPERAAICGAARVAAESRGDAGDLAALIALHDDVVVGLWAIAIRASGEAPDRAATRYRPLGELTPEREGPLVRRAAVRAAAAIGAARAVTLLHRNGAEQLRARAERWLTFGDAPLDVIERELDGP